MTYFPEKIAAIRGSDTALIDERGAVNWATFDDRTNRLVNAFRDLGLAAGDVIAIYAGNCREYFETMMAASHAGLVYVPVNWHFSPEELAYVVDNSGARALIAEGPFLSQAAAAIARGETPGLRHCISIRAGVTGRALHGLRAAHRGGR